VLCGCALFVFSFAFGRQRGVVWHVWRGWRLRAEQESQHLLRAAFEILENRGELPSGSRELKSSALVPLDVIGRLRKWSPAHTRRLAHRMAQAGLVVLDDSQRLQLTPRGFMQALSTVRDHRLLEKYMIEEAEAPIADADRAADYLEHDLKPEHLASLQQRLDEEAIAPVPPSPHQVDVDDEPTGKSSKSGS